MSNSYYRIISTVFVLALIIIVPSTSLSKTIEIEGNDYLTLVVGNYVHSFKEFDTSVVAVGNNVLIGIYYDSDYQNRDRAEELARRFRENVPHILSIHKWASKYSFEVSIYGEARRRDR